MFIGCKTEKKVETFKHGLPCVLGNINGVITASSKHHAGLFQMGNIQGSTSTYMFFRPHYLHIIRLVLFVYQECDVRTNSEKSLVPLHIYFDIFELDEVFTF